MLANEKVLLNNTIGKNRNFKHEIDISRKEISFAKLSNETMTTTINQLKYNISNTATETINSNRMAGETNNQILALKAKHEEEKESFEVEIKKL
jgi:5-methylcytosine-specific restriction endonuclease McrBC regulatory subunit McrC